VNERSLDRAIKMLQTEAFQLYVNLAPDTIGGIVKSQTQGEIYYGCWIDSDGRYSCYDHDLNPCFGQMGSLCKHLLVLIIGMTRNGELDIGDAGEWVRAASKNRPAKGGGQSAELILRFRGIRAGEVDWRPTETIPEDYYAL
jgi:hypothetical protein